MERAILEEAVSELREKVLVLEDQVRSRVAQAKAVPVAETVKSALPPRKTELERLQQKFRKRHETPGWPLECLDLLSIGTLDEEI